MNNRQYTAGTENVTQDISNDANILGLHQLNNMDLVIRAACQGSSYFTIYAT